MASILLTGAAGFIGSHTTLALLARGDQVIGLDNLNAYYDPALKQARLERVQNTGGSAFTFYKTDLADRAAMAELFAREEIDRVVHLAAQPGVRHSLDAPFDYVDANITGFLTILEGCRHHGVQHLVYASTSSVYGANTAMPYRVQNPADHPLALYGATKRANELMAHSYAHLFNLPSTGLRFFTVYGPWGRPDMSPMIFASKILAGEPIDLFNYGNHKRDFTYVGDIVQGILGALDAVPKGDPDWSGEAPAPHTSKAPWAVHNIGNQTPVDLRRYIEVLEQALGKKAVLNPKPLQPGDVPDTFADVSTLTAATGYAPDTPLEAGVAKFIDWYRDYFNI